MPFYGPLAAPDETSGAAPVPSWFSTLLAAGRAGLGQGLGPLTNPGYQVDEGGQVRGGGLFGQSPVGQAMQVGQQQGPLAGIADLVKMMLLGRGGFGRPPFSAVMQKGKPQTVYHGTPSVFEQFAADHADPYGLYGPGFYFTENPTVASGYARTKSVRPVIPTQEQLQDYFKPGDLVPGYGGGTDKVLQFYPAGYGPQGYSSWAVKVQAVDRNTGAIDPQYPFPRIHQTMPEALTRPQSAPNVRPAYLDITNPFRIDAEVSPVQFEALSRAAQKAGGRALFDQRLEGLPKGTVPTGPLRGDAVYNELVDAMQESKTHAQAVLQQAGYDGITHIGGGRTGTDPHRVWIAFHPKQIVPAFTPTAELP